MHFSNLDEHSDTKAPRNVNNLKSKVKIRDALGKHFAQNYSRSIAFIPSLKKQRALFPNSIAPCLHSCVERNMLYIPIMQRQSFLLTRFNGDKVYQRVHIL